MIGKPPNLIRKLNIEKIEALKEVAGIKSVQLELVRHSLLTRKVIKIEKQIEKLQNDQAPKILKIKNIARCLRVSLIPNIKPIFI